MIYRLLFSDRVTVTMTEVEQVLSLDDVQLMNFYLDAIDEALIDK